MTVYLKADIPDELHYRNNRRTSPILVVMDEGWHVWTNRSVPGNWQSMCAIMLSFSGEVQLSLGHNPPCVFYVPYVFCGDHGRCVFLKTWGGSGKRTSCASCKCVAHTYSESAARRSESSSCHKNAASCLRAPKSVRCRYLRRTWNLSNSSGFHG